MNNKEFWESYSASQVSIKASESLKETILSDAQKQGGKSSEQGKTGNVASLQDDPQRNGPGPHGRSAAASAHAVSGAAQPSRRAVRFALPIAACLAVLTIAAGINAVVIGGIQNGSCDAVFPDFAVQAYAAGTDTILEMGNDNQIIFNRDVPMYGIDKESYLATEGYYTGCLFRVEGEGITRIQASVSTGALYRYTYEDVIAGENPDKMQELVSWKPSMRGLGEYYGGYDEVQITPKDDGLPKDSPDKKLTVALTKKLGSTIDVPVQEDSAPCSFGFWTNEDYGDIPDSFEATDAVVDLFDGATLTVTATFADGHTTTQVIELHSADVKASREQDAEGNWIFKLSPEIVDPAAEGLEKYTDYIRTLYGAVKETNHEPFPGSLENANEFENVVGAPWTFERQPLTYPLVQDIDGQRVPLALEPSMMHPATDSLPMDSSDTESFAVSNVEVLSRSKTLPEGITLDDLRSGMGDWEYYNRVVSQIDGYTLDENGTPSDGFSWVMMEADVTNTAEAPGELTADGGRYGQFAITDGDGNISSTLARSFALLNGGWDTSKPGVYSDMLLDPQETKTVRWLAIVPDIVLDDPSFFYLTGGQGTYGGMKLEIPN